jgi:hypothetical protein
MNDLKDRLVRLGSENPELQKHIRPVLDRISVSNVSRDDIKCEVLSDTSFSNMKRKVGETFARYCARRNYNGPSKAPEYNPLFLSKEPLPDDLLEEFKEYSDPLGGSRYMDPGYMEYDGKRLGVVDKEDLFVLISEKSGTLDLSRDEITAYQQFFRNKDFDTFGGASENQNWRNKLAKLIKNQGT